jgi:hypothetical protein
MEGAPVVARLRHCSAGYIPSTNVKVIDVNNLTETEAHEIGSAISVFGALIDVPI